MTDLTPEAVEYARKTASRYGFHPDHVAVACFAEGYDDGVRAAEARVRIQVALSIAEAIEARPRQQYESPERDPADRVVGGYRPGTAAAYKDAAEIARQHAAEPTGTPKEPTDAHNR